MASLHHIQQIVLTYSREFESFNHWNKKNQNIRKKKGTGKDPTFLKQIFIKAGAMIPSASLKVMVLSSNLPTTEKRGIKVIYFDLCKHGDQKFE